MIAVTSRSFSRHPVLRAELLARYPDVRFNDDGVSLNGDALIEFLRGAAKAIVALEKINGDVLGALPELKTISKYGVGLDGIDLDALQRHGVRLGWTPGVNKRSVAELVIAAAINGLHLAVQASALVRGGGWKQIVGRQLTGRTVGIIGCGNIGKDVVRLLAPFACRILVNDIVDHADFYAEHAIEAVDLDTLLAQSDVVTIHVPLNDSTRNLLSAERLRRMRTDAILLNFARGGLVDEGALKDLLRDGKLAGAAFDVFATEPPTDPELLALDHFFALPHIGGSTEEAILAMGRAAIDGLDPA